jgi:hypothetical protein
MGVRRNLALSLMNFYAAAGVGQKLLGIAAESACAKPRIVRRRDDGRTMLGAAR